MSFLHGKSQRPSWFFPICRNKIIKIFICNKKYFCCAPVENIKISDIFSQNPKLPKKTMGSNTHTLSHKTLKNWAPMEEDNE